ncbi:MAG: hypothetical protein ABIF77_01090, partial [bacterium]
VDRDLHAGLNEVDVNLHMQRAQGQLALYTYDNPAGSGGLFTQFLRYFKWNRHPDEGGYIIIFHHDYDDQEDYVGNPGTVYEVDEVTYEYSAFVPLRKHQVLDIFGEDLFGMSDDEVVYMKRGSYYSGHDDMESIEYWLEGAWELEEGQIAGMWYEVYFE